MKADDLLRAENAGLRQNLHRGAQEFAKMRALADMLGRVLSILIERGGGRVEVSDEDMARYEAAEINMGEVPGGLAFTAVMPPKAEEEKAPESTPRLVALP